VHRIEGERFERDRVADRQRGKVDMHVDALGGRDEGLAAFDGARDEAAVGAEECERNAGSVRGRKREAGRFARSTR
jgi:hypothetical protein